MKKGQIILRTIGASLAIGGLWWALDGGIGGSGNQKPGPHFTISKETTYVTEPVDSEGYIDYVTALNRRLSKGVTPDNNANVLLWKAIGPHPEGVTMPPEYFHWLGVPEQPEKGDYFIGWDRFVKDHLKIDPQNLTPEIQDEGFTASERSWKEKEHPRVVAWLKVNKKPLALIIEATKRPQYFNPLIPPREKGRPASIIGALVPGVQQCRQLCAALVARAMLRIGMGQYKDAWQDLLASHRLGRLVGRGGTLIEDLVGIAIEASTIEGDLALLDAARLKPGRLQDFLKDFQNLPPVSPMADKLDFAERFTLLQAIMLFNRYGPKVLAYFAEGGPLKKESPVADHKLAGADWDPPLRSVNQWFDRLKTAMSEKDYATRKRKLDGIELEIKVLKGNISHPKPGTLLIFPSDPSERAKTIGNTLITQLIPAFSKIQAAADRAEQTQANLQLAFALAAYRQEHGHYPKTLDELAPKYLAKIPQDLFTGKPLIYRPSENGYLLYSVGVNGVDEGGQEYDDKPPGDDLAVRMPMLRRQGK